MIDLLYQLNALYNFYKSAHWLSKGESFYQDHLLFERLYGKLDDEMDGLAELMLIETDNDKDFDAKKISEETAKITPQTKKTCEENLEISYVLEERILKFIGKQKEAEWSVGLYNHLAAISQNHQSNLYLISRALKK